MVRYRVRGFGGAEAGEALASVGGYPGPIIEKATGLGGRGHGHGHGVIADE